MNKIKSFLGSEKGKDIMIVIIVILVGIFAFELGRLSRENGSNGVKINYTGQQASVIGSISPNRSNTPNIELNPSIAEKTRNSSLGSYFASNRGKKYYPIGCGAGKSIKTENRIYFQSSSDAEQKGYTLASSCK